MEPKTALVTGANRGIGLEVCKQLAERGLRIVLTARDESEGESAAQSLRSSGAEVRFERLDVADDDAVADCARRLREAGVHVDVLVNNAAIYPQGGVLDTPLEVFREVFAINLMGAVRACKAFVPEMERAGYGRVVNVSSGSGSFAEGLEGPAAYCISKAGLNALTVKLAQGVHGDIKVNAVCPGWVRTRMGGPRAPVSVEQGADTIVWLATLPADGPNGGFFRKRRRIEW
jgi:NAD(P)-dependent dehydrogenase (short-subunit alcohol dehydrogenase family)